MSSDPLEELPPSRWAEYPDTLADVLPWIAGGFRAGVAPHSGTPPTTALPALDGSDVVLLLVDGLGENQLAAHADAAPTLAGLRAGTLRAGFPSTTVTSITSLMTGAPAATHGIIGYSFRPEAAVRVGDTARVLNALRWTLDAGNGRSALDIYPTRRVAPSAGRALADLGAAGVRTFTVMPGVFRGTGFTQVAFGSSARYMPAATPDELRAGVAAALTRAVSRSHWPRFVYTYLSDLDAAGHMHGPGSEAWLAALRTVDAFVADLLTDLPSGVALVVTGDHGMLAAGEVIDLDAADDRADDLNRAVEAIAGEARARHVYAVEGAAADVAATWSELLSGDATVATREQVLDEDWFGAGDLPPGRVGDVVAVAGGRTILGRSVDEPNETRMVGHHGGWTADELLVPLLFARGE